MARRVVSFSGGMMAAWAGLVLSGVLLGGAPGLAGAASAQASSPTAAPADVAAWLQQAETLRQSAEVDWLAVRQAYEQAAALGSLPAMSYVGWIHEQGLGTPVNLVEAARWYAPVAEGGQNEFAIKLGWMYLQPALGPDRLRAEQWFQTAIARDSAAARVALASVLVADALGGLQPQRVPEAVALLEAAMAQGHPVASRFLARVHVEQVGGFASTAESRLFYTRQAAADGHAPMQAWLAQRYLDADGVPADLPEAAFWAALAAAQQDPHGQQLHRHLQARLTDEQRRAVMQRSLAWSLQQAGN